MKDQRERGFLKEYARAVGRHWVQAVVGPVVTIVGLVASSVFQWVIPPVLWLTVLLGLVSWAQYLAWKDARAESEAAETAISDQLAVFVNTLTTLDRQPVTNDEELEEWAELVHQSVNQIADWIASNIGHGARARFSDRTGMKAADVMGSYNGRHSGIRLNLHRYTKNLIELIKDQA